MFWNKYSKEIEIVQRKVELTISELLLLSWAACGTNSHELIAASSSSYNIAPRLHSTRHKQSVCLTEKNTPNLGAVVPSNMLQCSRYLAHNQHTLENMSKERCPCKFIFTDLIPPKCSDRNDVIYTYSLTLFENNGSIQQGNKVLIKTICDQKGYNAGQFMTKFLNKGWTKSTLLFSWGNQVQSIATAAGNALHALTKMLSLNRENIYERTRQIKHRQNFRQNLNKFYPRPLKIQITKVGAFLDTV